MARITLTVPGAVTAYDSGGALGVSVPPTMVGSPPQWSDDSDATYADLETFENPDVSYSDIARGDLERKPVAAASASVSVIAQVRYQSMSVDMTPPVAAVLHSGVAFSLLSGSVVASGSMSAAWLDIPLAQTGDGRMATFIDRLNDGVGTLTLQVTAPALTTYVSRLSRTRIYEARIVVITPSDDAPPCRIFPRSDGLGVGAGRAFPPPKSQQRSPGRRGVGYY